MTDFQSEIFTKKDCELIKAVAEIFSLKNVYIPSLFIEYTQLTLIWLGFLGVSFEVGRGKNNSGVVIL